MKTIGFFKRFLIICYDGLLLVGVIFLSSLFFPLLPDTFNFSLVGKISKSIYLLAITFLFYGWFWTHGGQTLGMKTWNLYLITPEGKFISWKVAAIRYLSATLSWAAIGLGFTWILLDRKQRAWHDIISNTQIVHAPKSQASFKN